jgi:glycosyltransferase involved in cell wall biosynthesis
MFKIDIAPVEYHDPWRIPVEERLRNLARGQRRVVYFYEHPDARTFRYRVYNMVQALEAVQDGTSAAYFFYDEMDTWDRAIDMADVIVVCRARYNSRLERALARARSKGKPIFFDIDDLVFDPHRVHLIIDSLGEDVLPSDAWDFWYAYTGRLGATLELCDRAITTTEYLAKRICESTGKAVSVIPNFLNREQVEISERIFQEKVRHGFARDGRFHLGYFSGSPTHNKDFAVAADAIVRLLDRDPRIVLRLVGDIRLEGPFQNFRSRIESYPLQDYVNLQRLVGEVEVNLVPLQENEFTNCKSELKYFEAGLVGTLTAASPTSTYAMAIQDSHNGYLVKSYEWYEKITALMDMGEDYGEVAREAFRESELGYSWTYQVEAIKTALIGD